jgi:hypothetical protein
MRISGSRRLLASTAVLVGVLVLVLVVGALVAGAALRGAAPSAPQVRAPAAVVAPEAATVSVVRAVS